jgi:hypothetical protein
MKRDAGIYVTSYLPKALGELAKSEGLPFSRLLRRAVIRELEDRGHPICVYCQRPIEPAPRFFTDDGRPRHMLCKEEVAA